MFAVSLFRDGRFQQTVFGPREWVINPTLAEWGGEWATGALDDSWWFYGQARKRPACPAVLEGLMLRGIRPGSTIAIEDKQYECAEGGDVELSFQFPGTYEVTVTRWPYLNGRYTVENPPPA
ncbi:hypothetical protein [Alcaligenes faecalis]|uniref:hypothetical protein n=1 Tax=Alcaligenes faecalis TaxID=511 RepID=UPI00209BD2EF|nr:hypothetical protein [Alcaligenes faecalis]